MSFPAKRSNKKSKVLIFEIKKLSPQLDFSSLVKGSSKKILGIDNQNNLEFVSTIAKETLDAKSDTKRIVILLDNSLPRF